MRLHPKGPYQGSGSVPGFDYQGQVVGCLCAYSGLQMVQSISPPFHLLHQWGRVVQSLVVKGCIVMTMGKRH